MNIRIATAADLPELAALFRQTVLTQGPEYYSPDQVQAWAATAAADGFRQLILGVTTYLAVDPGGIAGFGGISRTGHVASLYVHHGRLHQGVGSILMAVILDHGQTQGLPRLYGEASEFSLGLFQKFDFTCYGSEVVERHGVEFRRYLVERYL